MTGVAVIIVALFALALIGAAASRTKAARERKQEISHRDPPLDSSLLVDV